LLISNPAPSTTGSISPISPQFSQRSRKTKQNNLLVFAEVDIAFSADLLCCFQGKTLSKVRATAGILIKPHLDHRTDFVGVSRMIGRGGKG
jgi:hypothetical protein